MARVSVRPNKGGRWDVPGGGETHKVRTQSEGIEARQALEKLGGRELIVKGRDGKVRIQNTYGRPDPRDSKR